MLKYEIPLLVATLFGLHIHLYYIDLPFEALSTEDGTDANFTRAPKNALSTINNKNGGVGRIAVNIMKWKWIYQNSMNTRYINVSVNVHSL